MENIQFQDKGNFSQETIIMILKKYKFKFKPITNYDNNLFNICILFSKKRKLRRLLNKIFTTKFSDEVFIESTLKVGASSYYDNIDEEIVINREEVNYFINKAKENYMGCMVL